jgi:phospholipid/cholesterol/gamma-HCH transport system substrate-binding protein
MAVSPAAKVGMVTTAALVAVGAGLMWLTSFSFTQRGYQFTVTYSDVSGLMQGAPVMLMGVRVGKVEAVTPEDRLVHVKVGITDTKTHILEGSRFMIMSQGLVGEKTLEIFPPAPDKVAADYLENGDRLRGTDPARLEFVMEEVTQAFREFQASTDPKQLQEIFNKTAANLLETTEAVKGLGRQGSVVLTDTQGAIRNADILLRDLDRLVVSAKPQEVSAVVADLRQLSGGLLGVYNRYFGTSEAATTNDATLRSLGALAKQLEQLATTLNTTTSDPQVQKDLRETIRNLNQLAGNVATATNPINLPDRDKIAGLGFSPRLQAVAARTPGGTGLAGNLGLRVNLPNNYYQLGIEQVGEGNYLNLFFGNERQWAGTTGYHFGLVRSKIGVGIDHELTTNLALLGELYDPFRPTFRLGATYFPLAGSQYGLTAQWAREFATSDQFLWLGLEWRPLM